MIGLVVVGLFFVVIVAVLTAGLLGLFATPTPPSRTVAAARVAAAPRVLAEVFDGSLNASFSRELWEPITEAMVMAAANRAGYALVCRDNQAGTITYRFTKAAP